MGRGVGGTYLRCRFQIVVSGWGISWAFFFFCEMGYLLFGMGNLSLLP